MSKKMRRRLSWLAVLVLCMAVVPGVRAEDSDVSYVQEAYDAAAALPAPELKSVKNVDGGVKVSWNKVAGAVKYRVLRKEEGEEGWTKLADVKKTTYTDTGAKPGTKYTYTVRCVTGSGRSFTSGFDKKGKTIKYLLSAPVIVSADSQAAGIRVEWGAVNGAVKYRVLRKGPGDTSWTKLAVTKKTAYKDTTAVPGTEYRYTVQCVSSNGKKVTSSYDKNGVAVTHLLPAPVLKSVTAAGTGVKISWKKVSGAAAYKVLRKTGTGKWKTLAVTASASYRDTTVRNGKTYTYSVRCVSADGSTNTSAYDRTGLKVTYEVQETAAPDPTASPEEAAKPAGTEPPEITAAPEETVRPEETEPPAGTEITEVPAAPDHEHEWGAVTHEEPVIDCYDPNGEPVYRTERVWVGSWQVCMCGERFLTVDECLAHQLENDHGFTYAEDRYEDQVVIQTVTEYEYCSICGAVRGQ